MKFKEIKPGMTIHCPAEENALELVKEFQRLHYKYNPKNMAWKDEDTCYRLSDGLITTATRKSLRWADRSLVVDFDDLIDLEEGRLKHMVAEEIVRWLADHYNDGIYGDAFGSDDSFKTLIDKFTPAEIVQKIETYEAKKAAKPIKLEWYDVCRIIKVENDGVKKCVYEEEFKNTPFTEDESEEDIFKRYISEHDGEYFATVSSNLRVKKGSK